MAEQKLVINLINLLIGSVFNLQKNSKPKFSSFALALRGQRIENPPNETTADCLQQVGQVGGG